MGDGHLGILGRDFVLIALIKEERGTYCVGGTISLEVMLDCIKMRTCSEFVFMALCFLAMGTM